MNELQPIRPYDFPVLRPALREMFDGAAFRDVDGLRLFEPALIEEEVAERVREGLDAARQQAYSEGLAAGFLEGRAAAETERARHETDLMTRILGLTENAGQTIASSIAGIEREAFWALASLIRRLTPVLLETGLQQRLEEALHDAFRRLNPGLSLELRLNPGDAEAVGARIEAFARSQDRSIALVADSGMEAGGAELRWPEGGARFDAIGIHDALVQAIEQAASQLSKEEQK